MQKSLSIRKFIPIIAVVFVAVLLACLFGLNGFISSTARAEGNDAGNSGDADTITIVLDVNGRDTRNSGLEALKDDEGADLSPEGGNNIQHLRVRTIQASAIIDWYNDKHELSGSSALQTTSYAFVKDSVKNSASEIRVFFDDLAGDNPSTIYVEALSKTINGKNSRFSVILKNTAPGSTEQIKFSFSVNIESTFAQRQPAENGGIPFTYKDEKDNVIPITDKKLKVGGSVKSGVEEAAKVIELPNYSEWQFDLDSILVGKVLYRKNSNEETADYDTAIRMVDGNSSTAFWTVSSVDNLCVVDVAINGFSGGFTKKVFNNPTDDLQHTSEVSSTLELDSDSINLYIKDVMHKSVVTEDDIETFWTDTHLVDISIIRTGETDDISARRHILVPVKFKPSTPQKKVLVSSHFNLTVTSQYTSHYNGGTPLYFDGKGNPVNRTTVNPDGTSVETSGYKSIRVTPNDLVDYCYPQKTYGKMTFFAGTDTGSATGDYVLNVAAGDSQTPEAYDIVALKNNNYTIKFVIRYFTSGSDSETIDVLVSVKGDGAYAIKIPSINGKKSVSYNVMTSSLFKELRDAHYIMTSVESNKKDELVATLSNNKLKLEPKIDKLEKKGSTRATITMTFTNTDGQTLVITSEEFTIDIEAGSFWNKYEDWQCWLIIAACIIGGIALILFIVWIFIHSISKHKQEENATSAPVSSYIVKLNSTIAATQAQQRLAATQALSQASSQMLLGAGPTGTQAAPPPDTLQLATGMPSAPQPVDSTPSSSPAAATSAPQEEEENYDELIAKFISDEELLERIFVEKYEPKGMVRRTFFKSKDLQARELDKEKKRIIERYKTPMPMDEAIMSEAELQKSEEPVASTPKEAEESVPTESFTLDFDPDAPLFVEEEKPKDEFSDEKIDIDVPPEESRLADVEHRNSIIEKELAELKLRIDKVQKELNKNKSAEDDLREKIAKAEADDEKYAKDIEDLEFRLASAKQKEKDKITRDINNTEAKKSRNLDNLEKLRAELEALLGDGQKLDDIMGKLNETQENKFAEQSGIVADLEKAQADYNAYQERLAQVKAKQELDAKIEGLSPMLVAVNSADYEMRFVGNRIEKLEKERESLKTEVAAAKAQILGANDFELINELNTRISDANSRLSEIEREITKSTKHKSELNIEFTSQRRKANDYVSKHEIPLEELISAEDLVVGDIELNNLRADREKDRETAENAVAAAQAAYDDISASSTDVTMIAMDIASGIQDLENELETTQSELDAINAQMETASDDEKLMLMVDQGDKQDKIDELNEKIKQANIEGTKRKMEAQTEYDEKLEAARAKLDEASEEFKAATAKYDALVDTNPLDLIMSGCGIISQDQKKIEANNLKKQLEKSKNEIEQARLAAQMAQMEAEQAKVDAARASDEARAEAERVAQEAIDKAEQARIEAEEKARSESEAAEQARREAEEAAEQARVTAEEAAEQARREAEEAAEQARREAEEAAEQARREAEEAKRIAEEAAERARRETEEAMQAEAEEAKRKAQEEIEEMRRQAEEEAEAKRREEEEQRREEEERQKAENDRKEAIAAKVAARKEKIVVVRERMKDIKGDDDAKGLREQLYTMQLTFDEDERGSTELMDFYNKTMDDIQHAGEIATLKAENAKKPQRIVKKVTERVNRIPKKKAKPGSRSGAKARPGSRAGARPRPSGSRAGARPRPSGSRPGARRPSRPSGSRPPRR